MSRTDYEKNRSIILATELPKYAGKWVAFTMDGRRIVAAAETIEKLYEGLTALGEDAQQVVLDRFPGPEDDLSLGGAEMY